MDFSRLQRATWPFPVGSSVVHRSWDYMTDEQIRGSALKTIEHRPDGKIVCFTRDYQMSKYPYDRNSFEPFDEWFFLGKESRKRSGFGKFIARVENVSET